MGLINEIRRITGSRNYKPKIWWDPEKQAWTAGEEKDKETEEFYRHERERDAHWTYSDD